MSAFRFFTNSGINPGRGFRARWEIGCGGFFDKPGKISSPYFPNPFPIQKSCSYLIQAPKDDFISLGRISLNFQPIFFPLRWLAEFSTSNFFLFNDWLKSFQEFTAFALGGEDKGCNGTYVKAYDGDKETDNLILNKAGFQIAIWIGHFLLVETIFCANFKNDSSAEMLFLKVFIHHQTIS